MAKPYIVCHMMMTVDGRIDCPMLEKLAGSDKYYETLRELSVDACLTGRVTAQLEMAQKGSFVSGQNTPYGREGFSKKSIAFGAPLTIVVDSRGSLLWPDEGGNLKPLMVLASESASQEYLQYLEARNISWICSGKGQVDIERSARILSEHFGVRRLAVLGGGTINGAFLEAGLLDEISILLAPGVDARKGMTATFDGRSLHSEPVSLALKSVKPYSDGAIWIRYGFPNGGI